MTSTPDHATDNTEPERPNPSPGNTPPAAEGDTAPTEHQIGVEEGGSAAAGEISDDQLPDDLRPDPDEPR
jgi:hypothetical protein